MLVKPAASARRRLLAGFGADRDDLALLDVRREPDGEIGEALEGGLVEGEVRGGRHSRHRSARGPGPRRRRRRGRAPSRPRRQRGSARSTPREGGADQEALLGALDARVAGTSRRSPVESMKSSSRRSTTTSCPASRRSWIAASRSGAVARSSSPRMTTTARPSRSESRSRIRSGRTPCGERHSIRLARRRARAAERLLQRVELLAGLRDVRLELAGSREQAPGGAGLVDGRLARQLGVGRSSGRRGRLGRSRGLGRRRSDGRGPHRVDARHRPGRLHHGGRSGPLGTLGRRRARGAPRRCAPPARPAGPSQRPARPRRRNGPCGSGGAAGSGGGATGGGAPAPAPAPGAATRPGPPPQPPARPRRPPRRRAARHRRAGRACASRAHEGDASLATCRPSGSGRRRPSASSCSRASSSPS